MKVLIAGGSGLIGRQLTCWLLEQNIEVVWLSQRMLTNKPCPVFLWKSESNYIDPKAFEGVDTVINLAGTNIGEKRWTTKRKQQILQSRIDSINTLYNFLSDNNHTVKKIISISAIGIYGHSSQKNISETDNCIRNDFLSETAKKWELAAEQFSNAGLQLVLIRTGIVLSNHGGALKEFLKPFRFCLGVTFGNGLMYESWIHIDDLCQMIVFILKNNLTGVYNAVAPNPVTNKELIEAISLVKKPIFNFPLPEMVLKLVLGEMASMLLISQHVSSEKIRSAGFNFSYKKIGDALNHLLNK